MYTKRRVRGNWHDASAASGYGGKHYGFGHRKARLSRIIVPLDNSRYNEYNAFGERFVEEDSMVQVIRSADRHHLDAGWLSTHWHFSFDDYYDPENISFGPLRVFNDDVIKPASGFPTHPHKEMEIVTYVIDGTLEHTDSMGNKGQIKPGEIQRMSAGTGLRHSEYNASKTEPLHLVQLWIMPAKSRLTPSWEQKQFSVEARSGKLLPIAVSEDEKVEGAVSIHQDATIYTSLLSDGQTAKLPLDAGRRAYIFVVNGELKLEAQNGSKNAKSVTLSAGDQARVTDVNALTLTGGATAADFLLLDLP
jgi:redox-sensitive bicupin YhaK (pirin superfamily)